MIFFRKIFCILVIVYFNFLSVVQKALVIFIIIQFSFISQILCLPFTTKYLNYLESNQLITILMTILLSIISDLCEEEEFKLFLTVVVIFFNAQFLVLAIRIILIYKFNSLSNNRLFKWCELLVLFKRFAGFKISSIKFEI